MPPEPARPLVIPVARSPDLQPPWTLVKWDTEIWERQSPVPAYTLAVLLASRAWWLGVQGPLAGGEAGVGAEAHVAQRGR